MPHSLILGGARSGKSAYAEALARQSGQAVCYIATAEAHDAEMAARIAHHRARRPSGWGFAEAPLQLAQCLQHEAAEGRLLLVDCLTLWLSNLLHAGDARFAAEREAFFACLPQLPGQVVLVSNEVGAGIVPLGALSRRFVDEAGRLHQQLAAQCARVVLVVAGLPLYLKGDADAA